MIIRHDGQTAHVGEKRQSKKTINAFFATIVHVKVTVKTAKIKVTGHNIFSNSKGGFLIGKKNPSPLKSHFIHVIRKAKASTNNVRGRIALGMMTCTVCVCVYQL